MTNLIKNTKKAPMNIRASLHATYIQLKKF